MLANACITGQACCLAHAQATPSFLMLHKKMHEKSALDSTSSLYVDIAIISGIEFVLQQNIVNTTVVNGIEGMTARHALVCLGRTLHNIVLFFYAMY